MRPLIQSRRGMKLQWIRFRQADWERNSRRVLRWIRACGELGGFVSRRQKRCRRQWSECLDNSIKRFINYQFNMMELQIIRILMMEKTRDNPGQLCNIYLSRSAFCWPWNEKHGIMYTYCTKHYIWWKLISQQVSMDLNWHISGCIYTYSHIYMQWH